MKNGIFFQEISADCSAFLHELTDPSLLRASAIPHDVSTQLRQQQIERLEKNVATLRRKQAEFNARMTEYISHLNRLIEGLTSDERPAPSSGNGAQDAGDGIHVRCQNCKAEESFPDLQFIFARESDESILQPTECYVSEAGAIKKGVFYCSSCGGEMLTIQVP